MLAACIHINNLSHTFLIKTGIYITFNHQFCAFYIPFFHLFVFSLPNYLYKFGFMSFNDFTDFIIIVKTAC